MKLCGDCGGVVVREGDSLDDYELAWNEQHPELGQFLRNMKDGSCRLICRCSEKYWGL